MKQIYKRNLPLLGITEFFSFFGITAFWLLFLSQQGCLYGKLVFWKVFFI